MTSRSRNILMAAGIAAVVIILAVWWLFFASFNGRPTGTYVYVDEDDTADSVYHKLDTLARPGHLLGLRIVGGVLDYSARIRAGRYEVGGGTSTLRLLRNLRSGHQAPVALVVPVVHTMTDLARQLSGELKPDTMAWQRAFRDTSLLRSLGVDTLSLPSLFIPNTYEVYWNITPKELLQRMKREHDAYWTPARRKAAAAQGLSTNEVYTLASIVEQESANESERPMIARMYLNRLHQGMKLQADPTIKYALQDFTLRRIMHAHLMVDSPYNTYKHMGLPPGPICIPSLNAIESVLHPAAHDYLYMCAKEDFSGTHNFAATYKEHLDNARRYAAALDKKGVK